jgi:prepilin-type N-terminal cleavage/methylation domain-containing protein
MRIRKTGPRFKRSSEQAGFTLIELLIVVALIAILMTLVVPNVSRYRHKAAVAAAQGTAHCLETGFTGFNPQSTDPVDRYPLGIVDQQSLFDAGNQIGCKMPLNNVPVEWRNCEVIVVCPDGSVISQTCEPNIACNNGSPVRMDYSLMLGVPGYADTLLISSDQAIVTNPSPAFPPVNAP